VDCRTGSGTSSRLAKTFRRGTHHFSDFVIEDDSHIDVVSGTFLASFKFGKQSNFSATQYAHKISKLNSHAILTKREKET
jgi:hypothetical protein